MTGSDRRVRAWLFVMFQALYALTSSGNAFRVPDEFQVYYQTEQLVDAGSLAVPQSVRSGRFFGRVGLDGQPYAPYGPLIAILNVPHHLAARGAAWLSGLPRDGAAWTFVVSGLTMLGTSTGAALAVAGFHRAALGVGASSAAALVLSLLLGASTVLWPYGTSLYSEGWQAAAFIWAAVCLVERRIALAAALLATAGLIKFTSLIFVPGFLAAVVVDRSMPMRHRLRVAAVLAAGAAGALAIHLAWNGYRFGDAFEFGYDWGETVPQMPARPFLLSELPRGLAVLLVSPGKSLLLWAPALLLSATRLRECPRPLAAGVATSAIGGLVFYGAYLFPEGGYAHGPRHLVPIVPLLLLPAAVPGRPWHRELVTACAAVGFTVAALAASVSYLQDQALGSDFQRLGYYDRIDPLPGRAWNRYRFDYLPFVRTMMSGSWPATPRVGAGADFFFLHLLRARTAVADAQAIPMWLPAALLVGFGALFAVAVTTLGRLGRDAFAAASAGARPLFRAVSPPIAIPARVAGAGLVVLSLLYLVLFVERGWIPHDEGMIGQSAERILAGDLPHIDYEEPYTGGLAWLHAGVFRLTGVDLLHLRWLLFAGAIAAQLLTYAILRRYLPPLGAALGAWLALGWSFPNYFAALPSWWLLVCALATVWAFFRFVDTGRLRYAAAAGLVAGVSILVKQTGLYVLVALVIALLYGGESAGPARPGRRGYRVLCVGAALAGIGLALAILRSRLAIAELLYLLLPIAACSRLVAAANGPTPAAGWRRALAAPATAVAAASIPLIAFFVPYLTGSRLGQLVNGLFVLPQRRLQFAAFEMPPAYWIVAGLPLVALVMPVPRAWTPMRRTAVAAALWSLAITAPLLSLYHAGSYQLIWQGARGFAALLPIAVCSLLLAGRIPDANERWKLFGCVTMLAWASLVQFPFSAPIYFCYVTPLAVIAGAAAAHSSGAIGRPAVGAAAALLVAFAILSMNRGYVYNLGFDHEPYALNVPLNLPKARLEVSARDADNYRRVVEVVNMHLGEGTLVAGPDCPEIYFLTGQFSPSGSLFDFFVTDMDVRRGLDDLRGWADASVVVLNHRRTFTPRLSSRLVANVRGSFPNWTTAGPFEVRWR